jgi:hypothetical protein
MTNLSRRSRQIGIEMLYQVIVESQDEIISATWDGGQFVEVYRGELEVPLRVIDIWNYATAKPYLAMTASALGSYMMGWVAENEPGFRIETVTAHTISTLTFEADETGEIEIA